MLSFLFVSNLIAQNPNEPIETDSTIFLEPSWPDDAYTFSQDMPVLNPDIVSVARFTTTAFAYIRFDVTAPLYRPNGIFIEDTRGQIVPLTLSGRGEAVLRNLPINQNFSIIYLDASATPRVVGIVSTHQRSDLHHEVQLPAIRYDEVARYFEFPEGVGLYDFINTRTDWHMIEKISFLQDYLYYGNEIPDLPNFNVIPDFLPVGPPSTPQTPLNPHIKTLVPEPSFPSSSNPTDPAGNPCNPSNPGDPNSNDPECICRPLVLQQKVEIFPYRSSEIIGPKDWNLVNVWGGVTDPNDPNGEKNFGDRGRMWHSYGMYGPGKYVQAWMLQRSCHNNKLFKNNISTMITREGTGENFPYTSGNTATIKYTWACVEFHNFIPSECECDYDIHVRLSYRYNSQISAFSNTRSGALCSRSVEAFAEDVAVVAVSNTLNNLDPTTIEIVDANRVFAGSGCSVTQNFAKFFGNVLIVAFNVWKQVKGVKTGIGVLDFANGILGSNALKESVKNLIETPIWKVEGECGFQGSGAPITLINGVEDFYINTNKPFTASMVNNYTVHIEGRNRFEGNARIFSDYFMAATINSSSPSASGTICCRPGFGVYTLGLNEHGNRQLANVAFQEGFIDMWDNINNLSGHFGYRGANTREGCDLNQIFIAPRAASAKIEKFSNLSQRGQFIYFFGDFENSLESENLVILNSMGQKVWSQNVSLIQSELLDLNQMNWPSGIYFAYIEGVTDISKIIKL